jgi:succinate dehydrogenase / fumarate reductase, membrane anchor subunit
MSRQYSKSSRSSAFNWFVHRITGTFLVFLLITHFWVQHYDRTTASISHDVVTAEQAEQGVLPRYSEQAAEAVRRQQAARRQEAPSRREVVPAQRQPEDAPGPTHPPAETASVTPYEVLMLRLADPVYAVLWKGFNILFLVFALHHGFYGLNNILSDYIRNDMGRLAAKTLSWGLAFVLLVIGTYSVAVAGLNY